MKKMLKYIMMASIVTTACNSKSDLDTNKNVVLTDTTGMYKSSISTDTGSVIQATTLANTNRNNAVANRTRTTTNRTSTSPRSSSSTVSSSNNSTASSTTVTRKRGWSHAAKDATIGGIGGAVTGAIISKKKGKGAIIGGVLGAAGGYILGRSKDKKEGRY